MWNSEEPAATKHAQHAHELLWGIFYSKIGFYHTQNIHNSPGDRLGFIKPYHNYIVGEWLARVTRRLLKLILNFGHLATHILSTTQCCSTTREVIATSLHRKHWMYLLGQAESVCSWQKILTRPHVSIFCQEGTPDGGCHTICHCPAYSKSKSFRIRLYTQHWCFYIKPYTNREKILYQLEEA